MDIGQCRHVFTVYCNNTLLKISSQCHFKKKDGCLESNPVPFSVKQPNQELRKFAFIFGVSVQNSSFPFKISKIVRPAEEMFTFDCVTLVKWEQTTTKIKMLLTSD